MNTREILPATPVLLAADAVPAVAPPPGAAAPRGPWRPLAVAAAHLSSPQRAAWRRVGDVAAIGAVCVGALARFGVTPEALLAAFFAATLVLLASIDLEQRILPNAIVLPATALTLGANVALDPGRGLEFALACLVAAVVLALPLLVAPGGLGMGDLKLALLLGAGLGLEVAPAIMLGFMAVFPVALGILVVRGAAGRGTAIPFGPFLALGALVVLFA